MRTVAIAVALWAAAGAQAGTVQVQYADTSKFADFGETNWDRERHQKELTQFLQSWGKRIGPNQELVIEVRDVNLAGELEWLRGYAQRLRVMRSVTLPFIDFNVELKEGGQLLRKEHVELRDFSYLNGSELRWRGEALAHEKTMLDRWFTRQFLKR